MSKLPLFEKNAYLSLTIKDNGIWAHLAYTDHNASREYILSDFTDLNPLRLRLDDNTFTKNFWYEYFDNLEKMFGWSLVDKNVYSVFTFRKFADEGDGITGIRVQIDDNQRYFENIFNSVRDFSNDISLRVVDDQSMYSLLDSLSNRMKYDDILYIDMDIYDFSVYRVKKFFDSKMKKDSKLFTKSKLNWSNEFAVIDSLKDSRFKAFLATDLSHKELSNHWSNFILNRVFFTQDPHLLDILRAFSTIQSHSILRDNMEKLEGFGTSASNSALIVAGYIPRILGNSKTLLSLIDGFEFGGSFDCFWDLELKLLGFGKSYLNGVDSTDIILTRKDILSKLTKVLIPHVKEGKANKVVLSGSIDSLEASRAEFFALSPQFSYISIPKHTDKVVVECQFKNGSYLQPGKQSELNFISVPENSSFESILVDARPRPIIYGPDTYSNKLKLQKWINDNKA